MTDWGHGRRSLFSRLAPDNGCVKGDVECCHWEYVRSWRFLLPRYDGGSFLGFSEHFSLMVAGVHCPDIGPGIETAWPVLRGGRSVPFCHDTLSGSLGAGGDDLGCLARVGYS